MWLSRARKSYLFTSLGRQAKLANIKILSMQKKHIQWFAERRNSQWFSLVLLLSIFLFLPFLFLLFFPSLTVSLQRVATPTFKTSTRVFCSPNQHTFRARSEKLVCLLYCFSPWFAFALCLSGSDQPPSSTSKTRVVLRMERDDFDLIYMNV